MSYKYIWPNGKALLPTSEIKNMRYFHGCSIREISPVTQMTHMRLQSPLNKRKLSREAFQRMSSPIESSWMNTLPETKRLESEISLEIGIIFLSWNDTWTNLFKSSRLDCILYTPWKGGRFTCRIFIHFSYPARVEGQTISNHFNLQPLDSDHQVISSPCKPMYFKSIHVEPTCEPTYQPLILILY